MNWLITGGCGFIGVNLIERVVQDPANRVRILDNLSVGTREDLAAVTKFTEIPHSSPSPLKGEGRGEGELSPVRPTASSFFGAPGESARDTPSPLNGQPAVPAPSPSEGEPVTPASSPLKGEGWGEGESKVQLIAGDILDEEQTLHAAEGADVIVHLAANTGVGPSVENPRQDCVTNVIGILNMLEAARHNKVKRFIFASSGAPVGEVEPPIHEELAPHPVSPYGASKLAGEGYCSAYYRTFGVETVALRFGNVYGPRSSHKSSVVAKFIKQAVNGEAWEIYGDGEQTRDFIYIKDLVLAIELSASRPNVGGEIFQIATNAETTVSELTELLLPILSGEGIRAPRIYHGQRRTGDVRRNYSDTSKALERLGWRAELGLSAGLKQTASWFIS